MLIFDSVGLKPTWKANLGFLFRSPRSLAPTVLPALQKMMKGNLLSFVAGAAGASRACDAAAPGRQFRQPWSVEDLASCFVVKARGGQELAYIYYEDDPSRRSILKVLSREEARRIAVAITNVAMAA
jgi:hypothetical protein